MKSDIVKKPKTKLEDIMAQSKGTHSPTNAAERWQFLKKNFLLVAEKVTTLRVGDVLGANGRSPVNYVAASDVQCICMPLTTYNRIISEVDKIMGMPRSVNSLNSAEVPLPPCHHHHPHDNHDPNPPYLNPHFRYRA